MSTRTTQYAVDREYTGSDSLEEFVRRVIRRQLWNFQEETERKLSWEVQKIEG